MRQRLRGWGARLVALTLFGASVLVGSVGPLTPAAGATVCAPVVSQLDNASFEAPVLKANYQLIDQSAIPGWSTTATDRKIEIWRFGYGGVPAAAGNQFAELNATQDSALFQDLPTTPGQTLTWSRCSVATRITVGHYRGIRCIATSASSRPESRWRLCTNFSFRTMPPA